MSLFTFPSEIQKLEKSLIRDIYDRALPGSINLGLGEIQLPLPHHFKEKISEIIFQENIRYTPNAGLTSFRKKISLYYEKRIDYNNVCVTVGAEEALYLACAVLLNSNDEVLIADPAYPAYETIVNLNKAKPVIFNRCEDNDFHLDLNDLQNKITNRSKMIIISNPSNPLGTTLTNTEIEHLINICETENILLVIDEIYRDLSLSDPIKTLLGRSANIIIVSGLSKSHCLSGWRIGWIVAQNSLFIEKIIKYHQYLVTCAPFVSQRVGELALSETGSLISSDFKKILAENYRCCLDLINSLMPGIQTVKPQAAPYIFLNLHRDSYKFAINLLNEKIIVTPGTAFGNNCKNWIRINYALNRKPLTEALKRLSSII